jgi:type II secretory ATPase GspE/PulE/Tfp pilus assembly ATPase PilB-like protein
VLNDLQTERSDAQHGIQSEITEADSAIVKLTNLIVEQGLDLGASDIHIEPNTEHDAVVRYRVDGILKRVMDFPHHYRSAVVNRIKIMADLDIAERRRPQSGKIRFRSENRGDVELRVEIYPTVGEIEDVALRILSSGKPKPLDELWLSPLNLERLRKVVSSPYGIFLCVGPTGSGKTTTLHSALAHINDETVKIITAEDPVEITQAGLRQLQVNRKAGLSFADALRSFLRADPDVIMIGEMRDIETAGIAVEASLTGHLVFSTLHTNSAPETVTRLLDMGLDPYAFSDALIGVLAQRLLRTLCKACKLRAADQRKIIETLKTEFGDNALFDRMLSASEPALFEAKKGGCDQCRQAGYKGRMALHELLVIDDILRELIAHKGGAIQIRAEAAKNGMLTLKQDGIAKVIKGATTIEEVLSVCNR